MNIINTDFKQGIVKLMVNDPEDLWYLSHLVEAGDLVRGKTTRKIKIGEGENAKTAKKTFTLKIEAESIDLSVAGDSLKINGKIIEGPEDVPKGSYQSITLTEGEAFSLEKKKWLTYQKQKLQESAEKKYNYLLCLLDREEALFALTKKNGHEVLTTLKGEVEKKATPVEIKKHFYQEIIKIIEEYNQRYQPERIIIASPAFYKDDLFKIINSALKHKIVLSVCSDISDSSISEVLRRPELAEVLKNSRAREEELLVDELLSEINKNNLCAYGEKEVYEAINAGAVRKLLLTDNYIKRKKESGHFFTLDQNMQNTDALNGEIHLLSSINKSGKRIDGLGGIAAILRYKIK